MPRPQIKPAHRPVHYGGHHVRLGGIVPGIRRDLIDRDGTVWGVLCLLDGSRTVEDVLADMATTFPNTPAAQVRTIINDLVLAGCVEDADEPDNSLSNGLDDEARVRYSRSAALYQWMNLDHRRTGWDVQKQLGDTSVAVFGMGGVGCTAGRDLVVSGVGHVHCVDRDVVELSNLNRQTLYRHADIGAPKVEIAVHRLQENNDTVEVTGQMLDIDGPDVIEAVASRFDAVLLAADEPSQIRSWVNQACLMTGTPWVHAGYHGPLVSVGLYRPGTGPCSDCYAAEERARLARLPARTEWPPAATKVGTHAANAPSAGLAGNLAAHAVLSLITDVPALETNREFGFNLATLQSVRLASLAAPSPLCPSCGANM